ncbi:ODV-E66 [Epinotia aporema granulovirus]|uniref:ODV-E66 n=1 Tax=Epinotia aporema granulovirus TaxID=166056 RepID=K4ERT9_9BBAC|nr:ODV-E66 [Epinotia aporema granulovirus]AER41465.1 ODV-E66 [Epinotia aporema granulovirus]
MAPQDVRSIATIIIVVLFFYVIYILITRRPQRGDGDLARFHTFFKDTAVQQFLQKAEKIVQPINAAWSESTLFSDLPTVWTDANVFGTACHRLISFAVTFVDPTSEHYNDIQIAHNLHNALVQISSRLPDPAPNLQAPWGPVADWYHFTITMPEVYMCVTAALSDTDYYESCADYTTHILGLYLPTATTSLGWIRGAGNAMRMGVPYVYSQLLRGYDLSEIENEPSVKEVLSIISFPLVAEGNGLHLDAVYIDHIDVRAYGYLINSFFTFNYYIAYFGSDVINVEGLTKSILKVSCPEGWANPAVLSRQGTMHSNVMGHFVDYMWPYTHVAHRSKIVTNLTPTYFGSLVGTTTRLAYYEADPVNNTHAPLWLMNRRIYSRKHGFTNYTTNTVPFESGVLLQNLNGPTVVPSTTTSTQSFRPLSAQTAIAVAGNNSAMISETRVNELNGLGFTSCTLMYDQGLFQFYYKMGINDGAIGTTNARMVVLSRPTTSNTPSFEVDADGRYVYEGVTCSRVPVNNFNVPSLVVRTVNVGVDNVEQIISYEALYNREASSCFKLTVEDGDDLRAFNPENDTIYVTVNNAKTLFHYPYVSVTSSMVYGINNALETPIPVDVVAHAMNLMNQPLSYKPINCYIENGHYVLYEPYQQYSFSLRN